MIGYNGQIVTDGLYLYVDPKNPQSFKPGDSSMYDMVSGNVFTSNSSIHTLYEASTGTFNTSNVGMNDNYQWRTILNKNFSDKSFTITCVVSYVYRSCMFYSFSNNNTGPDIYLTQNLVTWNKWDGANNAFPNTTYL